MTRDDESKSAGRGTRSRERQEETLALLQILAMGNRDMEEGRFQDAEEVFAELDAEDLR